ncbi:hypothetical protein ILUMI_08151 [Ignelater luminosus]|uniref:Uncharacterized protein n=1 Tax=Ignelater luminosus TaxID=2038154 RepID=A0A8K0D255_IGNLU|nr:hypothetical protein ILUMI_08151 [Ignelater luminosus]
MSSPSQLLCSRNLRTRIPVRSEDLKLKVVRHQDTVKQYYNKRTRPLQPLREGDHSGNLFTRNRVMINPSPRQSKPTSVTSPTNSTLEFPQPVQIHQQIGDSTLQETAEEKAVKNLDNKVRACC